MRKISISKCRSNSDRTNWVSFDNFRQDGDKMQRRSHSETVAQIKQVVDLLKLSWTTSICIFSGPGSIIYTRFRHVQNGVGKWKWVRRRKSISLGGVDGERGQQQKCCNENNNSWNGSRVKKKRKEAEVKAKWRDDENRVAVCFEQTVFSF